jgi:hypothetical protein
MAEEVPQLAVHHPEANPPTTLEAAALVPPDSFPAPDGSMTADEPSDSAAQTPLETGDSVAKVGFGKKAARALAAAIVVVLAWLVPGLGHLVLRRWQRALAFFVAVGGLAVSGYLMRGNVFQLHSQDPFGTLGFLADASAGVFYLLAHTIEKAGPDVARAMGDYGTRFIAGAGIVNMLGVCDAFEVVRGRRY